MKMQINKLHSTLDIQQLPLMLKRVEMFQFTMWNKFASDDKYVTIQ